MELPLLVGTQMSKAETNRPDWKQNRAMQRVFECTLRERPGFPLESHPDLLLELPAEMECNHEAGGRNLASVHFAEAVAPFRKMLGLLPVAVRRHWRSVMSLETRRSRIAGLAEHAPVVGPRCYCYCSVTGAQSRRSTPTVSICELDHVKRSLQPVQAATSDGRMTRRRRLLDPPALVEGSCPSD